MVIGCENHLLLILVVVGMRGEGVGREESAVSIQ